MGKSVTDLSLWFELILADWQDFKTAHLLGVCPRAQFFAQLIGSAASAIISVGAYALYTAAWEVPGPNFPVPSARIWLDMADLVRFPLPFIILTSADLAIVGV